MTREQLYRYFNGEDGSDEDIDDEGYYVNEEERLQQYPGETQERWEDYDQMDSPRNLLDLYETENGEGETPEIINYNGQEGYFIPLISPSKRSYMSFMPPSKRFYPVDESPEASRWNALLAGAKERRGEQDMSERLYRLARALNGNEQYEGDLDFYKKK